MLDINKEQLYTILVYFGKGLHDAFEISDEDIKLYTLLYNQYKKLNVNNINDLLPPEYFNKETDK